MSTGAVTCGACGATVESAHIVRLTVTGQGNDVTLYLCPGCKEEAAAVPDWMGFLRDVIVVGLKKLVGVTS